ncbi:MAG TPA: hypothetical protein VG603_01535 [Chitinophagales bacterium]|nr:hypothetical protein [Chitinophagales bacterium]
MKNYLALKLGLFLAFSVFITTVFAGGNPVLVPQTFSPVLSDSTMTADTSHWHYSIKENKMTSDTTFIATNRSLEKVPMSFPYEEGTFVFLKVRYMEKYNNVYLTINQGQFNTGVDGLDVRVRFDNDPPLTWHCTEPTDGSTTTIFFSRDEDFIKKLLASKRFIVEVVFYDQGVHQIEFDTHGLVWDHLPPPPPVKEEKRKRK